MRTAKSGLKTGICALMIGLAATVASAADAMREIVVTGEGSVSASPDMATITIGVTEQAAEARDAMQLASQSVTGILARLEELGIDKADLQTRRLTVNPLWADRRTGNEPPEITGFVASNTIGIKVLDLPRLGEILDQVLAEGGNDFSGLQFGLQEPDPLMDDARRAAVADGMAKAQLYADAAGVVLGPVQSLTEQGGGMQPVMMRMAAESARAASVPIAEGEVTVDASVRMVFRIAE